jgi:hypothetical protein
MLLAGDHDHALQLDAMRHLEASQQALDNDGYLTLRTCSLDQQAAVTVRFAHGQLTSATFLPTTYVIPLRGGGQVWPAYRWCQ